MQGGCEIMYKFIKKHGKIMQFIPALVSTFIGIALFLVRAIQLFKVVSGTGTFDSADELIYNEMSSSSIDTVLLLISMLGNFIVTLLGIIGIALSGKARYANMCFMFGIIELVTILATPIMETYLILMITCLFFALFYTIVSYALIKIFEEEKKNKKIVKSNYEISEDFI